MAVSAAWAPDSRSRLVKGRLGGVEAVPAQRLRGVGPAEVGGGVAEDAALPQHLPREGLPTVALVLRLEGLRAVHVGVRQRRAAM